MGWKVIVGLATLAGLATGLATIVSAIATNWDTASKYALPIAGCIFIVGAFALPVVADRRPVRTWSRWDILKPAVLAALFVVFVGIGLMRNGLSGGVRFARSAGASAIIGSLIVALPMGRLAYQSAKARQKVCPDCAETVKKAANVCRYCGYRWSPQPVENPESSS